MRERRGGPGDGEKAASEAWPATAGAPRSSRASQAADPSTLRDRTGLLYARYGPAVYRRCLRLLRDREAAKDATQEVFVKLLRSIERFEDADAALPWAYRVATNHCINMVRDARRTEPLDAELEVVDDQGRAGYPEIQLARAILCRFDAQTQALAVGVFVDGLEHEEIAETLGISRRTVSRKLKRFVEYARRYVELSEAPRGGLPPVRATSGPHHRARRRSG